MDTKTLIIVGIIAFALSKGGSGNSVESMKRDLSNAGFPQNYLNRFTVTELTDVHNFYKRYNFNGPSVPEPLRSRLDAIGRKYNIFT